MVNYILKASEVQRKAPFFFDAVEHTPKTYYALQNMTAPRPRCTDLLQCSTREKHANSLCTCACGLHYFSHAVGDVSDAVVVSLLGALSGSFESSHSVVHMRVKCKHDA